MQALKDENEGVTHAHYTARRVGDHELSVLLTKPSVSWPEFLNALERFCVMQGWIVEYASVDDESCAIFFQPNGEIRHD